MDRIFGSSCLLEKGRVKTTVKPIATLVRRDRRRASSAGGRDQRETAIARPPVIVIGERNRSSRPQSWQGSPRPRKASRSDRGRMTIADRSAPSGRGRPSRTASAESAPAKRPASERWSAGRRRRAGKARERAAATALAAWPRPGRPRPRGRPSGRGTAPTAASPACGNRPARSRN